MKIRQTNAYINDIKESIEKTISMKGKRNFEKDLKNKFAKELLNELKESIHPAEFEKLIKWYFEKLGASDVWIPAKNESWKTDRADADVIAVFDSLKTVFYVQAKLHDGETDEWAVNQVSKYIDQRSEYKNSENDDTDNYTVATWVISTADQFSEKAIKIANEKNVVLIKGEDFAKMLINIGFMGINDVLI